MLPIITGLLSANVPFLSAPVSTNQKAVTHLQDSCKPAMQAPQDCCQTVRSVAKRGKVSGQTLTRQW